MSGFVGRATEIAALERLLSEARAGRGILVSMRGRRQVGKSRLVQEFLARVGTPGVFFTASRLPSAAELAAFADAATLGGVGADTSSAVSQASTWETALLLVTSEATPERPVVVVIDELPYLAESEPAIEAIIQKVWQTLERRAVLVILIGSDLAMMERLTAYDRPLYGRAREMTVRPLTVAEVATMRGLAPAAALDAYLVTGGFPRLAGRWRSRDTLATFLRRELGDEDSPLVVAGERSVSAEFPADLNARAVLTAIGAGERGYQAIFDRSGVGRGTADRALAALLEKRVIVRSIAYAEPPGTKSPRYVVADPYLRFWLRFIQPGLAFLARGRSDLAVDRVLEGWSTYRGRAIEPLVREAIERMLPHPALGQAAFVGAYWTRDARVEVDLVGGREPDRARTVDFVGSIKWRDRAPFDRDDLLALAEARSRVPGADRRTLLVGVSRSGFATEGLDLALDPAAIVGAWQPQTPPARRRGDGAA